MEVAEIRLAQAPAVKPVQAAPAAGSSKAPMVGGVQPAPLVGAVQRAPLVKAVGRTYEIPPFGREWELYIPGVAYQTENVQDGTRWLHTSAGASLPNNTLSIAENGTYLWKVEGKVIKGHWIKPDNSHVLLQKGYRGADWNASLEKFGISNVERLLLRHHGEELAGRLK